MENEIIVITGGTSGLGLELVKQSIEKGCYKYCKRDINYSEV